MDEELIELVRQHEELYNFAGKRYSDNVHKNKLWKQFAEILKKDPGFCKKRWESLRSHFRKICRFRKTKTGQAAQNSKKWKFEDELSFLLPYMKDKPRLTSMDLSSDESRESTAEVGAAENNQASELESSEETPSRPSQEAIPTPKSSLKRNQPKQGRASGKKKTVSVPETASSTLMRYILEQKPTEQLQQKNALDFFFDGIRESVKTFSPQDQHLAKKKIFEIVSEIEGKYLNIPNNPHSIQHYPNFAPQARHHASVFTSGPSSSQSATSSSCASYLQAFSPQYDERQQQGTVEVLQAYNNSNELLLL